MTTLKEVLIKNFEHLGFNLFNVEEVDLNEKEIIFRCIVLCPCKNIEYYACKFDKDMPVKKVAERILESVASKRHLEKDVEEGLLSPFDIDKHTFKGQLIE